jgi:hypothetical protein
MLSQSPGLRELPISDFPADPEGEYREFENQTAESKSIKIST